MIDPILQQNPSTLEPVPPAMTLRWRRVSYSKRIADGAAALALALLSMGIPVRAQSTSAQPGSAPSASIQTPATPGGLTSAVPVPSATTAPPEYRVGAGDVLGITVYNMPELNRNTVVGSEGTLQLSYLSKPLDVNGETAQNIGQEVASELKQLQVLIDPQVSVAVVQVESKPIVVGGNVRNPQVLQEVRPFTLLQALMLVGGPEAAAGNSVVVTRSGADGAMASYDLPLSKVLSGTDPNANIPIQPGDTIQVLPDQKVFVAGDVKNPGAFVIGRGQQLTVSKLMALTGGWESDAKPDKAVIVREDSNGQRKSIPLDLPKIMARKQQDVTLEANDLLYVPDSTGKKVGLTLLKGVGGGAALATGYLIVRH